MKTCTLMQKLNLGILTCNKNLKVSLFSPSSLPPTTTNSLWGIVQGPGFAKISTLLHGIVFFHIVICLRDRYSKAYKTTYVKQEHYIAWHWLGQYVGRYQACTTTGGPVGVDIFINLTPWQTTCSLQVFMLFSFCRFLSSLRTWLLDSLLAEI